MRSFALSAEQVESQWEHFAPLLERFEHCCRELTAKQIREYAIASKQQIFGLQDERGIHGVLVTEIQKTARGLVCVLVAACGTGPDEDKRGLIESVERWAKTLGCVAMRINGRKGWARWDRRFKQTGVILERPLCR